MASQQEPLKYQTWILRVPMHCEGCKRKVKKVLQRTDGVYTTAIDSQQNKVTVTGNVGIQTLIKKLARKAGKQADEWPEKLTGKENKSEKCKNKEKQKVPNQQSVEQGEQVEVHKLTTAQNRATTTTETNPTKFPGETSPNKATGGGGSPAVEVQISENEKSVSSKKKKGKGPKDDESGSAGSGAPACIGYQPVDPVDFFRARQMAYVYPLAPYHCYVPSSPYTCAPTGHQEADGVMATHLERLQVFSDENPNACFIM